MRQTPTRSPALIGRCALISRPDLTVGGKFTNHSLTIFNYFLDIFQGSARLDLAAIFASTGFNYFTHFCYFCFVVSIQPRLKVINITPHNFRCKNHLFSNTHYCTLWQYANFDADNSTVPLPGPEW